MNSNEWLNKISPVFVQVRLLVKGMRGIPFGRRCEQILQGYENRKFWYENDCVPEVDSTGKVSVELVAGDFERIMSRLAAIKVITPPNRLVSHHLNTRRPDPQFISGSAAEFRRSINFVLERLNDDGLMEATLVSS